MIHRHDWRGIGANTWVCLRCEQMSGRTIFVPRADWTTICVVGGLAAFLAALIAVFVVAR
jgi:hypothetical protein